MTANYDDDERREPENRGDADAEYAGEQPSPPPPPVGANQQGESVPPVTPSPTTPSESDVRTWGMACHLSALASLVLPSLGQIIGPLIVWLIKRDEIPFVDDQGKESLNFQISMTIYGFVAALLTVVLIGFILLAAIAIVDIVYVILATLSASRGEYFRYPLTIRFIK